MVGAAIWKRVGRSRGRASSGGCTDQAFHAGSTEFDIDFRFWAGAAAQALAALPADQQSRPYEHLCRYIAATFKTPLERRENLIDRLATAATLAA